MERNTENHKIFPKFNLQKEEQPLRLYLTSLFEDLTSRKLLRKKCEVYLTVEVFKEYVNLPSLVSMGLYRIIDKNNKSKVTQEKFVEGMINILTATKENFLNIFFQLCDFDNDGYMYLEDLNLIYFYMSNFFSKDENHNCSEIFLIKKDFAFSNFDYNSGLDKETFEKIFHNNISNNNININKTLQLFYLILCGIPIIQESLNIIGKTKNLYEEQTSINKTRSQSFYFKEDPNHYENNYQLNFNFQFEENETYNENLESVDEEITKRIIAPSLDSTIKIYALSTNSGSTDNSPQIIKMDTTHDFSPLQLSKQPPKKMNIEYEKFSPLNFLNKYSLNLKSKNSPGKMFNLSLSSTDQIRNRKFTCQGFIYKKWKKNKLKKIWLVLINKDLFYFNYEKNKFKGLHNLSSCYYYESLFESPFKNLYGFQIGFKNKKRTYFCELIEEVEMWLHTLEKVIQYRNIYNHYEIGKLIDKGQFGEVRLAQNYESNKTYAVKIIDKIKFKPRELDVNRNEAEVLSMCQNENIIKLIEKFESPDKIYLVLEYIEGTTLKKFLECANMNLNEGQLKNIIFKIAEALNYLSKLGVMHRDLKPENIMVTQDLQIKIIDFGMSRIIAKGEKANEKLGTYLYSAPEILSNLKYNKEVDIWSFGVIMFYILTNEQPYNDAFLMLDLLESETNFNLIFDNKKFKELSSPAQDIIKRCLSKQSNRIHISDILSHSWFRK
jgi:tRNA A-37 threonylcarbamoyl transferase component Bud32